MKYMSEVWHDEKEKISEIVKFAKAKLTHEKLC